MAAANLLRTEPAVHPADVPQPGDRVRVTWRRTGNTRESVVDEHGYYEGKGAVLMYPDTVTVEVIEPAPATEKPQFGDQVTARVIDGTEYGSPWLATQLYDHGIRVQLPNPDQEGDRHE